jgi:PAS domain S-box-containing protein
MNDTEKIAKQLTPMALKRLKNVSPAKERETKNRKKKMREGGEEWTSLERESLLLNIFSSIQDGISILDKELNIVQVNPTMEMWYHYGMPLVGRKCYAAYHGKTEPCEKCPTLHAIATEKASFEIVGKKSADGKNIGWLNLFSFPLVDVSTGEMRGVIEYVRDITDQKRAEDALRASEERFRALTESTSDWIWETDADDVYTYASPKIKDLLGYDAGEIIGKRPFEFMPPDEAERVGRIFHSIKESRSPINALENVNLHKDGRRVILETSGVPFFDSGGHLRGYRGIDRDVSGRKHSEEVLQGKERELQKRLKELQSFYDIAVGRELRMIQLKKEIDNLKRELGKRND